MNCNQWMLTLIKCGGWGQLGQKLVYEDSGVLRLLNRQGLTIEQALVVRARRIPDTPLIRLDLEWADETRTRIECESTAVYGSEADLFSAGYTNTVVVVGQRRAGGAYLIIDSGHPDEVIAELVIPCPFDVEQDQ